MEKLFLKGKTFHSLFLPSCFASHAHQTFFVRENMNREKEKKYLICTTVKHHVAVKKQVDYGLSGFLL